MKKEYTEFVPILETHNAGDRVFIKSILDAEGIVYFIQGEHVAPYLYNALPMRVMVKKDQADKAREILKDIELSYSYGLRKSSKDINGKKES
jgi:Putative prokaryotic signal transducing protein